MKTEYFLSTPFIGLALGILTATLCFVTPSPFEGLNNNAWHIIGIALLMAIWWISEAVPIPVTALVPIILAPVLSISTIKSVTTSYAHPLIFLFLGGFMLSLAMEKCKLHHRIALTTLLAVGNKPSRQIAGIMGITAFLSMWMSNTATAVMMLPIGLSIIELVKSQKANSAGNNTSNSNDNTDNSFAIALLLSIAYSASIGGVATLIGTPPNALLAAYLSETYDIQIGFAHWMLIGLPISSVMLFFCWLWLTHWHFKLPTEGVQGTKKLLLEQLFTMGNMNPAEIKVAIIFGLTALAWITRPLLAKVTGLDITDTGIVMFSVIFLFSIPVDISKKDFLLNWDDTKRLPWGVLLLFGGGLSLASMINSSGLASFIAEQVTENSNLPLYVLVFAVTGVIVLLTETTSNTATAAGFLPLLGPISLSVSDNPLMLTIPAILAASCAFMMPMATPPNSVVFASGEIRVRQMVKTGFVLDIFSICFISAIGIWAVKTVFGG